MSRARTFTGRRGFSTEALSFGRQRWLELTRQLRAAAEVAVAGGVLERHAELLLVGAVKRTGGAELPVEGASAVPARAAMIAAANGFLMSAGERRSLFARLLIAAVDLVEALLDAEALAAANRTWKRHLKED